MIEEVIKIKSGRTVEESIYFTNVDADTSQMVAVLDEKGIERSTFTSIWKTIKRNGKKAYALKGEDGNVVELIDKIDNSFYRRDGYSSQFIFLNDNEVENVVEGFLIKNNGRTIIPDNVKNFNQNRFLLEAKAYSGNSAVAKVFFNTKSQEDYNVDICIHRTIDTLDTLSVKNNPLSEFPNQESSTGIVTGTLYAKQIVKDENGERVLIPLSNVPIVIFNPSDTFPNVSSVDEIGDRVTLNLIQNSKPEDYADIASYVLDVGKENAKKEIGENNLDLNYENFQPLLKSYNTLNIPEQYKYSTITNEKGEFIIHDIPIGNQILMFEVDLLKQGMTKDEVSLNFYPYATEEEPNVDKIPHFYFRQIPIGITSSWGDFQTGYTEVNITANLDMRKWSTFFVSPISFGGKNIEELFETGRFDPLTILARDMTRQGYPLASEIVEISDVFDRVQTQRLEWFNEFKTRKPKIEFRNNQFQAFKVPANLYDPNGNASKNSERSQIRSSNGVWLCSYEFKFFYNDAFSVFRSTGFVRSSLNDNAKSSNHFDLNRNLGFGPDSVSGLPEDSSIGKFPYEKPWTINYPEPYQIPSRPFQANESKNFSNIVEPRYFDGDSAGFYYGQDISTGYGAMQALEDGEIIYNKFAQAVTNKTIYKYENDVSWHEEYSNGFRKSQHSGLFPGKSFNVLNGEKYQRVEAGFMYWLKPEGWGRINAQGWGDFMLSSDINSAFSAPQNLIPPTYIQAMSRQGEDLTLKLDTSITPKWLQKGSLDIYRIIHDTPKDVSERRPPLKKRFSEIKFNYVLVNNKKVNQQLKLKYGSEKDEMKPAAAVIIEIRNNGSLNSNVTVNGVKQMLKPAETKEFSIFSNSSILLESNSNLNLDENYYANCNYTFAFKTSEIENAGEVKQEFITFNKQAGASNSPTVYYAITRVWTADGNIKIKDGEKTEKDSFGKEGTYEVNGLILEKATRTDNWLLYFDASPKGTDSSKGGFSIFRLS
jgi:hypothetical protein